MPFPERSCGRLVAFGVLCGWPVDAFEFRLSDLGGGVLDFRMLRGGVLAPGRVACGVWLDLTSFLGTLFARTGFAEGVVWP